MADVKGYSANWVFYDEVAVWRSTSADAQHLMEQGLAAGLIITTEKGWLELGHFVTPGPDEMVNLLRVNRDIREWLSDRLDQQCDIHPLLIVEQI